MSRTKSVPIINRTSQTQGPPVSLRQDLEEWTICEILPDHRFQMRITGQQGPVAMEHRNCGVVSKRQAGEELFEVGRLDTSSDGAEEFAVRPGHLAGDHGGPGAGDATMYRFDQNRWRLGVRFERLEIGPIGDIDGRNRPYAR